MLCRAVISFLFMFLFPRLLLLVLSCYFSGAYSYSYSYSYLYSYSYSTHRRDPVSSPRDATRTPAASQRRAVQSTSARPRASSSPAALRSALACSWSATLVVLPLAPLLAGSAKAGESTASVVGREGLVVERGIAPEGGGSVWIPGGMGWMGSSRAVGVKGAIGGSAEGWREKTDSRVECSLSRHAELSACATTRRKRALTGQRSSRSASGKPRNSKMAEARLRSLCEPR